MCIYIYIYIHVCVYIYIHITYIYIYTCICVCVYIMYIYIMRSLYRHVICMHAYRALVITVPSHKFVMYVRIMYVRGVCACTRELFWDVFAVVYEGLFFTLSITCYISSSFLSDVWRKPYVRESPAGHSCCLGTVLSSIVGRLLRCVCGSGARDSRHIRVLKEIRVRCPAQ